MAPGMTAMAAASKFWDRMADHYARQPIADEDAYRTKLKVTQGYFRPDMEVLEFGCGTGGTAVIHAPYVRQIRAIDFSEKMLDIARRRATDAGVDNVSFERADIADLAEVDRRYDAVLGLSILHLLADKDAVIAKVFAMLKPGGIFVSSTTCIGDTMRIFKFVAPIGKAMGMLPQLDVMTVSELVASIAAAGFEIDHQWQPGKGKAVFIVARKPAA